MIVSINTVLTLEEQLTAEEMVKFREYIKKNLTFPLECSTFAEESNFHKRWFDLWPRGRKSGGYYVRCDEGGCRNKMKKFIKEHPKYSEDIILRATERYINSLGSGDYMKLAPYFILKDGVSMLAGYCEAEVNQVGGDNNFTSEAE